MHRVAQDDRHHRRILAHAGVEMLLLGQVQEQPGPLVQPGDAFRLRFEQPERGQRGRGVRRRNAHAVNEAGGRVLEILDDGLAAGDVAAATAERLAQRPHPQVDVVGVDVEVFADAAPVRAEHADGMGLVDHQEGLVLLLDLDELRQVRDVAVHAVDAFDGDQHAAVFAAQVGQQLVDRRANRYAGRPPPGAGENAALDDAVMRQGVVQDQIAGAEQVADRSFVGRMAADVDDGIFGADEFGNCPLQFAMHGLFARNQPAGRDAGSVTVDGVLGGLGHHRIARHADVVVAGEVDQLAAVDHASCRWSRADGR